MNHPTHHPHASGTRVYFWADPECKNLLTETPAADGQKDHYEILEVVPVCGESRVDIESHWKMVRVETPTPWLSFSNQAKAEWKGTVRHLHYTAADVRAELQKKSALPYPPSESTLAVLIPIRKSDAWWNLSQDERQKYFEKKAGARNHTTIGFNYAERIYRKLYHSRYLEAQPNLDYDFLTYFEFDQKDRPLFESLLRELRNVELNPEWKFVDFELEIWMNKREQTML